MHTPPDIDPGYEFDEKALFEIYEFLKKQDIESGSINNYEEVIFYLTSKAKGASVTAIGIAFNSIIRQTLANLKASADQGMSFAQIFERYKEDPLSISSGWKIRMVANFASLFPAAEIGRVMGESGSGTITQAFVAALVETAIGIFPEIKAGQPTREKLGGVNLDAKTLSMIRAAAPFYLARNFSMWMATHIELENSEDARGKALLYRGLSGIFAGAISAIPDSMANRSLMEIATSDSLLPLDAIRKTLSEDPKIFLMRSLRGAYLRGIGGGFSAILFSKEGREVLEDALGCIINAVTEFLNDKDRGAGFLNHLIKQMQDGSDEIPIDYRDYLPPAVFSAELPVIDEDLGEKPSIDSIRNLSESPDIASHRPPIDFPAFQSLPPVISAATQAAPYPFKAKDHLVLPTKLGPPAECPANTFFLRILENFNKVMSPDGTGKGGTGL